MTLEHTTECAGREVSITDIRKAKRADNIMTGTYTDPLVDAYTALEISLGTFVNSAYNHLCVGHNNFVCDLTESELNRRRK